MKSQINKNSNATIEKILAQEIDSSERNVQMNIHQYFLRGIGTLNGDSVLEFRHYLSFM